MSSVIIYDRIQLRQGTAANLAAVNETLLLCEPCIETDTGRMKIGDGVTAWNDLRYTEAHYGAIGCTFDGGGSEITPGAACDVRVPFNCVITKATILADQTGSIEISVWADTLGSYPPTSADNICGSAPPTITGSDKSEDASLSGWTITLTAGQTVRFTVASCSAIERATLILDVLKS